MSKRPEVVKSFTKLVTSLPIANILVVAMAAFISFGFYADYKHISDITPVPVTLSATSAVIEDASTESHITNEMPSLIKGEEVDESRKLVEIKREHMVSYIMKVNRKVTEETAGLIADKVVENSYRYNIPEHIIMGVMERESHFNVFAVSSANCIGLMQINPRVWKKELKEQGILQYADGNTGLFDPSTSIDAGVYILSKNLERRGTHKGAILAYFGGHFPEYYSKVMRAAYKYENHMEKKYKEYESNIDINLT